ncbi:MAG: VOC family protein [Pseudomonadales bacterium]|nr:VOC family protein [Pseudomonadales bacterium]
MTADIRIRGLDHLVLRTTNPDTMKAFYVDVLGCTLERELPAEVGLIQLRAGNALIDLVIVDSKLGRTGGGAPSGSGNNLDHFCLLLERISAQDLRTALERKGVSVGEFGERYGSEGMGESVYIHDPDGNVVELRASKFH